MDYTLIIDNLSLARHAIVKYGTGKNEVYYFPDSIIDTDIFEAFISINSTEIREQYVTLHVRYYIDNQRSVGPSLFKIVQNGLEIPLISTSVSVESTRKKGFVSRLNATVKHTLIQELIAAKKITFIEGGESIVLPISCNITSFSLFLASCFGLDSLSEDNRQLLINLIEKEEEKRIRKLELERISVEKKREQERLAEEKRKRLEEERKEKEAKKQEELALAEKEKEKLRLQKEAERDLQLRPYAKVLTKYILFNYRRYQYDSSHPYYHYLDSWHTEKYVPQFKDKDRDFEIEVLKLLRDRRIIWQDNELNKALFERCRLKQLYDIIDKNITADEVINNTKPNGCYIATSIYGSYNCPEVWTLRRFRDQVLSKTWYGRFFIKIYYAISPTMVKWFGDANWFQAKGRVMLDKVVKRLQISGFDNTPYRDIN